jgi:hypothetical protein
MFTFAYSRVESKLYETSQLRHLRMYHAGEIKCCENLDIVLFWWLVVRQS